MVVPVTISRAALARLLTECEARQVEVCGLLLGLGERVEAVEPAPNIAGSPAVAFEVDPAALCRASRRQRSGGPELLGYYHSHPGGSAAPSVRDAEGAAPDGKLWLIVAGGEIGLWRAVADGPVHGRFLPVPWQPGACQSPAAPPQGAPATQGNTSR